MEDICSTLHMAEANEQSFYLGLPNILTRNKFVMLGFLIERVRKRIQNWDGQILSRGEKEILLKTVVQALPTFAMSVFLIPLNIIKSLERIMNRFRYQTICIQKREIHWTDGVEP